jgi:Tfp pilus assembly protein PilN
MTNIEFLPPHFRDQGSARRGQLWHVGVFVAFGGLIATAAIYQFATTRTLQAQLDAVQPQYDLESRKSDHLSKLRNQLNSLDEKADLICYLDHPWPSTQVLTAVVTPLPESIKLKELRIVAERAVIDRHEESPHRRAKTDPNEKSKGEQLSLTRQDLKTLRDLYDQGRTVVHLSGTARDTNDLHGYIANLSHNSLVRNAELSSIEAVKGDAEENASRFQVRLVIAPGFGQPNGPNVALTDDRPSERVVLNGDQH